LVALFFIKEQILPPKVAAMVRNRPSNVLQIRFERMIEQAKNARTEFLREKFWRPLWGQKMRKQSKNEGLPELAALLAIWLLFYGLLVVHGLTTPYAQRLAKAWTVQDNAGGDPGEAQAVRTSLSLFVDTIAR
jgi:hypothetical protein